MSGLFWSPSASPTAYVTLSRDLMVCNLPPALLSSSQMGRVKYVVLILRGKHANSQHEGELHWTSSMKRACWGWWGRAQVNSVYFLFLTILSQGTVCLAESDVALGVPQSLCEERGHLWGKLIASLALGSKSDTLISLLVVTPTHPWHFFSQWVLDLERKELSSSTSQSIAFNCKH